MLPIGDWLIKGAIAVFSVACLAIALPDLFDEFTFSDEIYLATITERRDDVSRETLEKYAQETEAISDRNICATRIVKSGLTLSLRNLDYQNPDQNYDQWSEAMRTSEKLLLHALTCTPTNGNLWLRLAMIRQQTAELADQIGRLTTLSQLYAPAEQEIVLARFLLWNRMSLASIRVAETAFEADVELICKSRNVGLSKALPAPSKAVQAFRSLKQQRGANAWCEA